MTTSSSVSQDLQGSDQVALAQPATSPEIDLLLELYSATESSLKVISYVTDILPVSVINELRYSLRHVLPALIGNDPDEMLRAQYALSQALLDATDILKMNSTSARYTEASNNLHLQSRISHNAKLVERVRKALPVRK